MTPERHERLMACFDEACDLDAPAQAAYVERLKAEDAELAAELASLLRHDRAASDTMDAFAGAALGQVAASVLAMTSESPSVPPAESATAAPDAAIPGMPDLEMIRSLAQGGMGHVWLARQRSLERDVAIKVARAGATSTHLADVLFTEARLAGSLEHPNIVPVHLLGHDSRGLPVLVMKRVEGVSWSTLLREPEHPAWTPLLAAGGDRLSAHLTIVGSVCHALHFAHSRGIIHRDIKPDNVMVGAFGEVYLVDWGIAARLSPPGPGSPARPHVIASKIAGTLGFLAPEMAQGGIHDVRTDVYLLGATLHQVLTGEPRHNARAAISKLAQAVESRPVEYGPGVPHELAAICNRATHVDPAERFPTAEAFREAIALYLRHRDSIALAEAARLRLDEIRALEPEQSAASDARRLEELFAECQFAFHESLRVWPENPVARAALRECLTLMVAREVKNESLVRARALLSRIDDPPAELREQVAVLEDKVRERDARAARQIEEERSRDWRREARARTLVFLGFIGLTVLLWRVAVRDQVDNPHPIPPPRLAVFAGAALAGMSGLVWLFRRRIFVTTVTRHVVLGTLCGVAGITANRALHALQAPPTASILSGDLVIAATVAAVGAIVLVRWLWLLSPIFLAGAFLVRLLPQSSGILFAASCAVCAAIGIRASGSRNAR